MTAKASILPRSFILSRLHSLTGLWIVLFLIEHLVTNSQAALYLGSDGQGFIHMVNLIKNIPYVQVVEIGLIGIPIVYHALWGIHLALKGKINVIPSDGSKPVLPYSRNFAYTLQRVSAWILLVGVIAHVAFMRFSIYPIEVKEGSTVSYFVRLNLDKGLYTLSNRLNFQLYDLKKVHEEENLLPDLNAKIELVEKRMAELKAESATVPLSLETISGLESLQRLKQQRQWILALIKRPITSNEVIAVSADFGTATLLNVRDAFKSPVKIGLYTIFVLAACFHGFNGLWTFLLSWGLVIRVISQKKMLKLCVGLMALIAFLGLSSVWGTYFINLKM